MSGCSFGHNQLRHEGPDLEFMLDMWKIILVATKETSRGKYLEVKLPEIASSISG